MNITKSLLLILFTMTMGVYAQAKKPTIMVVPGDTWCKKHNFTKEFENYGETLKVPDYPIAMVNSDDLLIGIKTVNALLSAKKFPLKKLETSLEVLKNQKNKDKLADNQQEDIEDIDEMRETSIDKLHKIAKADVWVQVMWKEKKIANDKRKLTLTMQAFDAYSNEQIAELFGTSSESSSTELTKLLVEAIRPKIDDFTTQIEDYFIEMATNGRRITFRVRVEDTFEGNLTTKQRGTALSKIIENWVMSTTVQSSFSSEVTDKTMLFEQVYIPMNNKGKSLDARTWASGLQKILENTYQIQSKLVTRGLGTAQLIILGE